MSINPPFLRAAISLLILASCSTLAFQPHLPLSFRHKRNVSGCQGKLHSTTEGGDATHHEKLPHPMADTSCLSHVMLRVPSVRATVDYWTQKGAIVRRSRPKNDDVESSSAPTTITANGDKPELLSAFVEMGSAVGARSTKNDDDGDTDDNDNDNDDDNDNETTDPPVCFALELVSTNKANYSIGNCISYLGVSMLLQFQNNLLGAISGDSPNSQGDEPNGIPVQSAASAPGDLLARLAFTSNDLAATHDFYTTILGMEAKGQDDVMLCLRYDNNCFAGGGIPTTLIFNAMNNKTDGDADEPRKIEMGDCFDHIAIATQSNIEDLYGRFDADDKCKIFMKPTDMFGKKVMGLLDPNGYKVILASQ